MFCTNYLVENCPQRKRKLQPGGTCHLLQPFIPFLPVVYVTSQVWLKGSQTPFPSLEMTWRSHLASEMEVGTPLHHMFNVMQKKRALICRALRVSDTLIIVSTGTRRKGRVRPKICTQSTATHSKHAYLM